MLLLPLIQGGPETMTHFQSDIVTMLMFTVGARRRVECVRLRKIAASTLALFTSVQTLLCIPGGRTSATDLLEQKLATSCHTDLLDEAIRRLKWFLNASCANTTD